MNGEGIDGRVTMPSLAAMEKWKRTSLLDTLNISGIQAGCRAIKGNIMSD